MPTLDDYSRGTAETVRRLEPLFLSETPVDTGPLAGGADIAPLTELASRWREASAPGPGREARLRIEELRTRESGRVELELEAALRGFSRGDPQTRVSVLARFRIELVRAPEGSVPLWRIRKAEAAGGPPPIRRGRPHLVEEAKARGLDARHETLEAAEATNLVIPATHHHPGVLLVDVDGDGALDVVLPSRTPRLFLNDGLGRFHDATRGSGLDLLPPMEASGGAAVDLDGDGLPELFLTGHFSSCVLLKNEGGGKFRDVTAAWGLASLAGPYTSAVFFDADRDGRVDLFVACYGDARKAGPAYDGRNGESNRFFRNVSRDSHPFFVDETASSGLGGNGWGFAASACDYDGDGDDDLYVANDFGKNFLFENRSERGRPRFVNVAKESGTEDEGFGMGVTWGDYDGDGRFDLHVSDFFSPYRWILRDARWPLPPVAAAFLARRYVARVADRRSRGDGLFRNLGNGRFERTTDRAGVADGGWAWGTEFVDLDGKGLEDLLVVNGMFEAAPGGRDDEIGFWNAMGRDGVDFHDGIWGRDLGANGMASKTPKKLFVNRGDGTFEDRAWVEGFDTLADARGLAYGDLDGDGAPDVVVATFRGPLLLYRNGWGAGAGHGRIRVVLGQRSGFNLDALGVVVRLVALGRTQIREVRAGSSFLSQSSRELLFGLGASERAERIEVRWPDGLLETLRDVPANSRVVWLEGEPPRVLTGESANAPLPR